MPSSSPGHAATPSSDLIPDPGACPSLRLECSKDVCLSPDSPKTPVGDHGCETPPSVVGGDDNDVCKRSIGYDSAAAEKGPRIVAESTKSALAGQQQDSESSGSEEKPIGPEMAVELAEGATAGPPQPVEMDICGISDTSKVSNDSNNNASRNLIM